MSYSRATESRRGPYAQGARQDELLYVLGTGAETK
jgi:hypothetical protein